MQASVNTALSDGVADAHLPDPAKLLLGQKIRLVYPLYDPKGAGPKAMWEEYWCEAMSLHHIISPDSGSVVNL